MTYLSAVELLIRIMAGGIAGLLIGHERKSRDKSAGMRTHAIVAMGAALVMVVSKYGFSDMGTYDASRVASQIVSGVGFLGAGIIFIKNNSVSGLTTAAGIWTTAGIGMAMGAGMYLIGFCTTVMIIMTQVILHKIDFLAAEPYRGYLNVTTDAFEVVLEELQAQFDRDKIKIITMSVNKEEKEVIMGFDLLYPPKYEKIGLIAALSADNRIQTIQG